MIVAARAVGRAQSIHPKWNVPKGGAEAAGQCQDEVVGVHRVTDTDDCGRPRL